MPDVQVNIDIKQTKDPDRTLRTGDARTQDSIDRAERMIAVVNHSVGKLGPKALLILLITGSLGLMTVAAAVAWVTGMWPAGPLGRPETPNVAVIVYESRNADRGDLAPHRLVESRIAASLTGQKWPVVGTELKTHRDAAQMINEIAGHNWWKSNRPIHVLVFGESSATYRGPRVGTPYHDWEAAISMRVIDVASGADLIGAIVERDDHAPSSSSVSLWQSDGSDPFEDLATMAARKIAADLSAAWQARRNSDASR